MLRSFIELFFPRLCESCKFLLLDHESTLCLKCETALPFTGIEDGENNFITRIFSGRVQLRFGYALLNFHKEGMTQQLLHHLKYNNGQDIGRHLGRIAAEIIPTDQYPDLLVPVPLHHKKQKKRGYNQSESIAQGMGEILQIPVANNLLHRKGNHASQTSLNRKERWQNVSEEFELKKRNQEYQYIWMIDDTVTTGATLEACMNCFPNEIIKGIFVLAYAD